MQQNVVWYDALSMNDVDKVGGKNASLGDIVSVRQKNGRIVAFELTAYKTNPNKFRWAQMNP